MKSNLIILVAMFGFELLMPTQSIGGKVFIFSIFLLNVAALLLHIYYPNKPQEAYGQPKEDL